MLTNCQQFICVIFCLKVLECCFWCCVQQLRSEKALCMILKLRILGLPLKARFYYERGKEHSLFLLLNFY